MPGPKIPDDSHLCRYCGFLQLDPKTGKPAGAAFVPRADEHYLSVNWLEKTAAKTRLDQVNAVREHLIKKGRSLGQKAQLAVLHVGKTCEHVKKLTPDSRVISVHDEEELPDDPSHAGIYGYTELDTLIADLIASVVLEEHPARG